MTVITTQDRRAILIEEEEVTAITITDRQMIVAELPRGMQGPPGPEGPEGPEGPPGPPAGDDLTFVHNQQVAQASWTITHGMGKHPSVSVVDSSGSQVYGNIIWLSSNQIRVDFSSAFAGKAYLN